MMAVSFKIDPIDRDIALMMAPELAPAGRSKALAAFAREQLSDAQAINRKASGKTPSHETFVDGRRGAEVDGVRPDGTIVFEFELVLDMLKWIGEQLAKHSPVLSGAYSRSHALFADGTEVPAGATIPAASEYVFLSTVPYARRIELGSSDQAPEGVYEAVETLADRRFGNVAKTRFTYRPFRDGKLLADRSITTLRAMVTARTGMTGKAADREASMIRRRRDETRSPAIVVKVS